MAQFDELLPGETVLTRCRATIADGHLAVTVAPSGWPAMLKHLTAKKISVVVGIWRKAGSAITLNLQNRLTNSSCQVQAYVDQVRQTHDGKWHIRCNLRPSLSRKMLESLV